MGKRVVFKFLVCHFLSLFLFFFLVLSFLSIEPERSFRALFSTCFLPTRPIQNSVAILFCWSLCRLFALFVVSFAHFRFLASLGLCLACFFGFVFRDMVTFSVGDIFVPLTRFFIRGDLTRFFWPRLWGDKSAWGARHWWARRWPISLCAGGGSLLSLSFFLSTRVMSTCSIGQGPLTAPNYSLLVFFSSPSGSWTHAV